MTTVATIYDAANGYEITSGLQTADLCNEAINTARQIAASRNEEVVLEDSDGYWLVSPDGSVEETTAKACGFEE